MNNHKEILDNIKFLTSVENIDKATSTVLENSLLIFLPFKRIDKTEIHKKFLDNNQMIEVSTHLFERVEIRGRLLGQGHKDILEALLSMPKEFDSKKNRFNIITTAYQLIKVLDRNKGNKKWILQRLKEISECRVNLYFDDEEGNKKDFNFGFISSILGENEEELTIHFTSEYTHFLVSYELLDYKNYISNILSLDNEAKRWSKEIELKSKNINSDFLKAIIRYMLQDKGNNSQMKISNLIEKLGLNNIISKDALEDNLIDLRRPIVQKHLKEKFGLYLTNNNQTITFNAPKS